MKSIDLPLKDETIEELKAGDSVTLSGVIYTARDAAHKRFADILGRGEELPLDLRNGVIFYAGPAPAKPGEAIGSVGPTTSYRMDKFTPMLLKETGLKGLIGKGMRSLEVQDSIRDNHAVYFGATGGIAALLSECVIKSEVVLFPELGPEAVHRLEVKDMPLVVINDCRGNCIYDE